MDGTPSVPGTPTSGSNGGSMIDDHTPSSGRTAPPTLEELEAMDGAKDWKKAELESSTPGASNVSGNSKRSAKGGLAQTFSRQVSRISGTGRPATALQHQPKQATAAMGMSTATPLILASIPVRLDRTEEEHVELEDGPRPRVSTTNFEETDDRRINAPTGAWEAGPVSAPSRLAHCGNEKLAARKASSFLRGHSAKLLVAAKANGKEPFHHQPPDLSSQRTQLESYSTKGVPTATKRGETIKRPDHPQHISDDEGINGDREEEPGFVDVILKSPTKRTDGAGFDSDMDVDVPVVEKTPNDGASSCGSPACWGGGLPPMRNAIAQGPPTARAAAARAPPVTVRYPETRQPKYPSSDKESFARTLKDEELEELWQGLGEGVSQRGGGSEVAFEAPPAPTSPGTTASGAFPMLTANVLERHDQLAGDETRRPANVMPMPKGVGDKGLHGMENGDAPASSSKKNQGSSNRKQQSLLGLSILYGVLVLWMVHLVFNVLLLRTVILNDHQYLWVLCLAPGLLGTLFSINSCYRNGHPKCKPTGDREEEEEDEEDGNTRSGPHACALPSYVVLLLLVVVALGMHASALLFCEQDLTPIFFSESTLDPLCDEDNSLLLPVVLDAVLLMVASLKASSLCWAWVLS